MARGEGGSGHGSASGLRWQCTRCHTHTARHDGDGQECFHARALTALERDGEGRGREWTWQREWTAVAMHTLSHAHSTTRRGWAGVLPCTRTDSTREGWRGEREGVDMAARVDCGGNAHAVTRTQHDTTGMGRSASMH